MTKGIRFAKPNILFVIKQETGKKQKPTGKTEQTLAMGECKSKRKYTEKR